MSAFRITQIVILFCSLISLREAQACQYLASDQFCVEVKFDKEISRKSDSKFTLRILEKLTKKTLVLDSPPKIKLWMVMKNGHGHGSEKLKISEKNKTPIYLVENVWFLMKGEWKIKVEFFVKGVKHQQDLPVCVKRYSKDSHLGFCK